MLLQGCSRDGCATACGYDRPNGVLLLASGACPGLSGRPLPPGATLFCC